jgi:hypothetical protein
MRAQLWLPILYVIVAGYLVFGPPGAAGHGGGGEVFFYMSLPVGFISLLVQSLSKSGELTALSCLIGGVIQYFIVGYAIDRLVATRRVR